MTRMPLRRHMMVKKMNSYYNNEENNDEVALNPPTYDENINVNYDDKENDYEVTPDTPKNGVNNETIDNYEEKIMKKRLRRKQLMKNWI